MLRDAVSSRSFRRVEGGLCVERCPGYWAADGSVSYGTAVRAWQVVREQLALVHLSPGEAVSRGFTLRDLVGSQRRGSHWLAPEGLRGHVEGLLHALGEDVQHPAVPQVHDGIVVETIVRGSRRWTCCPEHEDRVPSAMLNAPHGATAHGTVWCFVCAKVVGLHRTTPLGEVILYPWATPGAFSGVTQRQHEARTSQLQPTMRAIERAGSPGHQPRFPAGTGRPIGFRGRPGHQTLPRDLGYVVTTLSMRGATQRYTSCHDLLDALCAADRQVSGSAAQRRMHEGHYAYTSMDAEIDEQIRRRVLPERLISLDMHGWESLRSFRVQVGRGEDSYSKIALAPQGFRPRTTRWVAVDLDDFDAAPVGTKWASSMGENLRQWAERSPHTTGRIGIIQTSHRGVQVVIELEHARWDPRGWYRDPHVRAWLTELDRVSLSAARLAGWSGGHADTAVHAAGRNVRMPGPRIDKDGLPFNARLVYYAP